MKIPCGVIMDLLPLYQDGVCNESSKKLVEEHVEECVACRRMLDKISNNTIDNRLKQERNGVVGHHKKAVKRRTLFWGTGIAVAVFTLLLLVDAISHGSEWFSIMTIPALYGSWVALFLINKHLKANALTRAGLCVILGSLFVLAIETLYHFVSEGVLRLRFGDANLFVWDNLVTLNANIDLLVLLTCGLVGGILLGIGLFRKKRN